MEVVFLLLVIFKLKRKSKLFCVGAFRGICQKTILSGQRFFFFGVYTWHLFIGYLSQLVYNYQAILSQLLNGLYSVVGRDVTERPL